MSKPDIQGPTGPATDQLDEGRKMWTQQVWRFLAIMVLVLSLSACGDDESSNPDPDTADDVGGDLADNAEPDTTRDDTAEPEVSDTAESDATDTSELSDTQEIPTSGPWAWIHPTSPGESEAELVELLNLDGDGSLHGTYGRVWQCGQESGGDSFVLQLFDSIMPATTCVPEKPVLADAEGTFLHVTPPTDPASLSDDYAALAAYYSMQLAHEFFSTTHGWTVRDDTPLDALVNTQAYVSGCDEWLGLPGAFYLNTGFLPVFGGVPLFDSQVLAIGQVGEVDLAHFIPLVTHEYTHFMLGHALSDVPISKWGTDHDSLALGEAVSDYAASAMTGQSVHAGFDLESGEQLDVELCGGVIGTAFSYEGRRDLNQQLSCPASLVGQMHSDGEIVSSTLWSIRQELGEPFDSVVVDVMAELGTHSTFEQFAAALITAGEEQLDATDAATLATRLQASGLTECDRVVPFEAVGARGKPMAVGPWLSLADELGPAQPATMQLSVEVPADAETLALSLSLASGLSTPTVDLLLKQGAPIEFGNENGRLTHDATIYLPTALDGTRATAEFTTPCLQSGTWYAAVVSRDQNLYITQASAVSSTTAPTTANPTSCGWPTLVGRHGCFGPGQYTTLAPSAGEEGHLAAARLTPESYPFTVEGIAYELWTEGAGDCHAGLPHRVELYVSASQQPAANPTADRVINMTGDGAIDGWRTRSVDLDEPLVLETGEHLIVAITMSENFGQTLCLGTCLQPDTPNAAFWSNAAAPPYNWAELSTFGLDGDLMVVAFGAP